MSKLPTPVPAALEEGSALPSLPSFSVDGAQALPPDPAEGNEEPVQQQPPQPPPPQQPQEPQQLLVVTLEDEKGNGARFSVDDSLALELCVATTLTVLHALVARVRFCRTAGFLTAEFFAPSADFGGEREWRMGIPGDALDEVCARLRPLTSAACVPLLDVTGRASHPAVKELPGVSHEFALLSSSGTLPAGPEAAVALRGRLLVEG
eukprot:Hpha_TRINITY_DN21326_c0_g1::TRINITY_DN21326_c0_g1_i1::g.192577::m.192577